MTLSRLQEIFPQDDINVDTTIGAIMDLNDGISLEDSRITEWDEVDTWLEGISRTSLFSSIEHHLAQA